MESSRQLSFVHISADTGLHKVHPTWAGTYILDACVFLFPSINFALINSDCVPVTLFEIRELWFQALTRHNQWYQAKLLRVNSPAPLQPHTNERAQWTQEGICNSLAQRPNYRDHVVQMISRLVQLTHQGHLSSLQVLIWQTRWTMMAHRNRVPVCLEVQRLAAVTRPSCVESIHRERKVGCEQQS